MRAAAIAQHAAAASLRVRTVFAGDGAIDDHATNAGGFTLGVVVGGRIGDGTGVEQHQIGGGANGDAATTDEAERVGCQRRHPSHGLGKRKDIALAHIARLSQFAADFADFRRSHVRK